MAKVLRKTDPQVQNLADAINDLKTYVTNQQALVAADIIALGAAATVTVHTVAPGFHYDAFENPIASATATDLPTSITLLKEMMGVYGFHIADTLAHKIADTTNVLGETLSTVVDLASAITAANDLKAKFNLHIAVSTTTHVVADSTNAIGTSNATDLASLETLLNATKTKINAHIAAAVSAKSIRAVLA